MSLLLGGTEFFHMNGLSKIGLFHQWHLPCRGHTMVKKSIQGEIRKVYNVYPYTWYYPPFRSVPPMRQEMMAAENMMMSEPMKEMINMMKQHMMTTNEIKRTVDSIEERCRRMEEMMKGKS
ncbi:hypothetical protein [Paenibacillus lautus]|nr:hypothetical protein [Paenibacillus lautus]